MSGLLFGSVANQFILLKIEIIFKHHLNRPCKLRQLHNTVNVNDFRGILIINAYY
jgi:hypothetical protein